MRLQIQPGATPRPHTSRPNPAFPAPAIPTAVPSAYSIMAQIDAYVSKVLGEHTGRLRLDAERGKIIDEYTKHEVPAK